MNAIARHFWLLALAMTGINALILRQRIPALTAYHPERAAGYRRLVIGFVAVNAVIWSVMGVGIELGGVPTMFSYFHPASGDPFVLAFHGTNVTVWIAGIVWLFFKGGAQFIVDHPGLANVNPTKPIHVQLGYLLCLAGVVAAEVMMWSGFFPAV